MRIQFFSDIHLEFGTCNLVTGDADILIAAGDISIGTTALKWLGQADCPVIYIAGNHEYYGGDLDQTLNELQVQSRLHDIYFLENDLIEIDKVRFLGTTLWTDFNNDKNIMDYAAHSMNDYNYIAYDGYVLTPEDILAKHKAAREWLENKLAEEYTGKTVVITHHAPTTRSWYDEEESMHLYSYCNRLEDLIRRHDIDLWIHGHIHAHSDYVINDTRVVCNPRGYCDYQNIEGYSISKTLEI